MLEPGIRLGATSELSHVQASMALLRGFGILPFVPLRIFLFEKISEIFIQLRLIELGYQQDNRAHLHF
jgi:hypothetical protein